MKKTKFIAILLLIIIACSICLAACNDDITLSGKTFVFSKLLSATGEFADMKDAIIEEYSAVEIYFSDMVMYINGTAFGNYELHGKEFSVSDDEITIDVTVISDNIMLSIGEGKSYYAMLFVLKQTDNDSDKDSDNGSDSGSIMTAQNLPAITSNNWGKITNKTASTTITITDAEIALGVKDNDTSAYLRVSAQIDLERTLRNGVLTIDVAAELTKVELFMKAGHGSDATNITSAVKSLLSSIGINIDDFDGLKLSAQIFYYYGRRDKTIGIRDMAISGLASALPVVVQGNPGTEITDEPFLILFTDNNTGEMTDEISYNLMNIQDIINTDGTIMQLISILFGEDYELDFIGMVEDLIMGQTMLDFSNVDNALYRGNSYTNTVKATDNLHFISEVWNDILDKEQVAGLVEGLVFYCDINNTQTNSDDDVAIDAGALIKNILGVANLNNLIPDLFNKIEGEMTVSGVVEGGIFTSLNATIENARLSLTQDNVDYILQNIYIPLIDGFKAMANDAQLVLKKVAEAITDGDAYISLGTITVSSTFTTI